MRQIALRGKPRLQRKALSRGSIHKYSHAHHHPIQVQGNSLNLEQAINLHLRSGALFTPSNEALRDLQHGLVSVLDINAIQEVFKDNFKTNSPFEVLNTARSSAIADVASNTDILFQAKDLQSAINEAMPGSHLSWYEACRLAQAMNSENPMDLVIDTKSGDLHVASPREAQSLLEDPSKEVLDIKSLTRGNVVVESSNNSNSVAKLDKPEPTLES